MGALAGPVHVRLEAADGERAAAADHLAHGDRAFAVGGYAGTSTDAVAKEAGVTAQILGAGDEYKRVKEVAALGLPR